MRRRFLLLPLLVLAACGDKDDSGTDDSAAEADTDTDTDADADADADADTDTDADADPDCASVDPTMCATRTDCAVITSRPVQTVGEIECIDWSADPVPVGCMDADMGCDDAVYLATGPGEAEDSCDWWFSSGCIPSEYTVCESAEPDGCPE